jgi:formylglycine-generating enzyme required for sulfatase activity/regulator of sirC expression with transglutaminase-like and TPR domain
MAELFRYAAFISYSSADARFAQRLHRALESYGIPASLGQFDLIGGGKKNRIYPVFRDREELSAGHLGDQIEANLKASAALIVVCSPNGAASPWVQKEIEFFAAQGRPAKVFAIIPDTAPLMDENGADATQSCFPRAFRGDALAGDKLEPLAADARKGKDGFRNAWLKIVAGMVGVTPGQIVNRDRRRRRMQVLQAAAVSALAALAVGGAFLTQDQWRPKAEAYWQYGRFVHAAEALSVARPGAIFQDCQSGSVNCPVMVVIPEGQFLMGTPPDDFEGGLFSHSRGGGESPQRQISIARFAVSKNEITFANWQVCFDAGACGNDMPDRSGWDGNNRPVINISWDDAQKYVAWLSRVTGNEYRLLTEAEWEYSARGTTTLDAPHTRFSWGDDDPVCQTSAVNGAAIGACRQQSTWPVGSFPPNAFGLHDMFGNVRELVEDCFGRYDPGQRDATAVQMDGWALAPSARGETNCRYRVGRGGAWDTYDALTMRAAFRGNGTKGHSLGFRVARTIQANQITARRQRLVATYINNGFVFHNDRDYARAIRNYDQAIRLDPHSSEAFIFRGAAYRVQHNFRRAIADLNEAIRLNPRSARAFKSRADVYADQQNYERAISDLDEAIRLNPRSDSAFIFRGNVYSAQHNYARAISDLDEAIRLNPRSDSAFIFRGNVYSAQHNYARAISDLDEAIRLNPRSAVAFNNRCWTRAVWGRQLDQALADCNLSLSMHNSPATIDSRGLVHLRRGEFEEAIVDYDTAVRGDANSVSSLYGRGVARLRLGLTAEGQADIAAARARDANIVAEFAGYGISP